MLTVGIYTAMTCLLGCVLAGVIAVAAPAQRRTATAIAMASAALAAAIIALTLRK